MVQTWQMGREDRPGGLPGDVQDLQMSELDQPSAAGRQEGN